MILLTIAIIGLALGSFVNALVWRLRTKRNWVSERSMCPHCKHELAAKDLVPVLSWLSLRGECRYCRKPIPVQYPAVELLTMFAFIASYIFWPYELTGIVTIAAFAVWLVCLVVLMALLVYDLKWMLLPNKLVATLTGLSVVYAILLAADAGWRQLFISLGSGLLFFGLFWVLFQVSSGRWIGGGDVKLALPLGILAGGFAEVFLLIFLASLIGTLYILPGLASRNIKAKTKLPFGPLLIIATVLVVLFGQSLIQWYLNDFLYL